MTNKRGPSHIRDRHRAAIARSQPPCHICGAPIDYTLPATDEMSYVVDHDIPLALGGRDDLTNKRAAHRLCNARKGKKIHAPIIRRSGALMTPGGGTPSPPPEVPAGIGGISPRRFPPSTKF